MAQIVLGPLAIGSQDLREYLAATGSRAAVYQSIDVVPAPAVAALMLKEFLGTGPLPAGVIQTSQHLEVQRAVAVGEPLTCLADVSDAGTQGGRVVVTVRITVRGTEGEVVLRGQSHLLVPPKERDVG